MTKNEDPEPLNNSIELSDLVNILPNIETAKEHIRGWYGYEPGYSDREGDFVNGVRWTLSQIERGLKSNRVKDTHQ